MAQAAQSERQRGWSPEQIAGRLQQIHAEDPFEQLSHDAIHAYVYAQPREFRKALIGMLRQAHKKRRPTAAAPQPPAKTGADGCAISCPSMTDWSRSKAARWPATWRAT